ESAAGRLDYRRRAVGVPACRVHIRIIGDVDADPLPCPAGNLSRAIDGDAAAGVCSFGQRKERERAERRIWRIGVPTVRACITTGRGRSGNLSGLVYTHRRVPIAIVGA